MFTWRPPARRFSPLLRYRAPPTADMRHPRKELKPANIVAVEASVTNAGLSQPHVSSALRIRRCSILRRIQLRQKPSGWGASVGVQPPTSRTGKRKARSRMPARRTAPLALRALLFRLLALGGVPDPQLVRVQRRAIIHHVREHVGVVRELPVLLLEVLRGGGDQVEDLPGGGQPRFDSYVFGVDAGGVDVGGVAAEGFGEAGEEEDEGCYGEDEEGGREVIWNGHGGRTGG